MTDRYMTDVGLVRSIFGISSATGAKRNLTLDYIRGIVMMLVLYHMPLHRCTNM